MRLIIIIIREDKYFKYNIFNYISCDYITSALTLTLILITIVIKINIVNLLILILIISEDLLKDSFIITCKIKTLDIITLINIKCNKHNFINTTLINSKDI